MPLACENLTVAYGRHPALRDISFGLDGGRVHALIGPNGSGKSTALHALAGLVRPAAGHVDLNGRRLDTLSRREIARQLAFLPQQPVAPDEMTVEQLVRQARFGHVGLFRRYRAEDEAAIRAALDQTGLADFADRGLGQLSGGERQRAWIAAALAQQAAILLLDEPTTYLDIGHQIEVLDIIHRLSRDQGVTIVMAIHDINQALSVADRILLLRRGQIAFDGTPSVLADTDMVQSIFGIRGRYVRIDADGPPHLDVELARRQDR